MATTVESVTSKTQAIEINPKAAMDLKPEPLKEEEKANGTVVNGNGVTEKENGSEGKHVNGKKIEEEKAVEGKDANGEEKKEEVPVEVEPKTGVSFPVRLEDGKQLKAVGLRKKSMLGMGIKIYAFGIYADHEKLGDLLRSKIGKAPAKPTKEMYQMIVDSDIGMVVRMVIVFSSLTMNMVRKNFDEGLGASIRKLTGGKNDELAKKIMGEASDDIKLTSGSIIEISRLPGFILQTKVMGNMVSKVESELLCRAYVYMYLGEDPFDKEAKEKFGMSSLSLF